MTGWIAAGVLLAVAAGIALAARRQKARLIRRLDAMLTAAMEGYFSESSFDESRLSALESRLAQYLAASSLSARNLQTQRDQISALISDISHQTRTPVANLQLYAQLLAEQPLTDQGRSCVEAIEAQSEKLQTLIEALVKSSRLETGLLALHPQPGPVGPMVERAMAQYAPRARAKQIDMTAGQTGGGALFDPRWTEEALCNLLDNALKYTPAGGNVWVEVHPYELFTAVSVRDTGPGIPESEQAKIFGRFYRAPGACRTEGLGIGLYLTRQIAAGQGGYVRVKSAPGQGSTFSLYLPRG